MLCIHRVTNILIKCFLFAFKCIWILCVFVEYTNGKSMSFMCGGEKISYPWHFSLLLTINRHTTDDGNGQKMWGSPCCDIWATWMTHKLWGKCNSEAWGLPILRPVALSWYNSTFIYIYSPVPCLSTAAWMPYAVTVIIIQ